MSKKREIDVDQLRDLIESQKLQHRLVSQLTGIPEKKMTKFCRRYGIKTQRTGPRSGTGHPSWKGGRIIDKDGYVILWMPTHPSARKSGYYLEHRYLMECTLRRLLDKREVVHHRSKNKQDNRIENLILFSENSEHLKHELVGKTPKWSEAGRQRTLDGVQRWRDNRKALKFDAPQKQ